MSDEGDKTCPLCAEEMDLTDQQLKPCKCGYEICVWCWHHIMEMAEKDETEGRCPACRTPYDKERIVGTTAKCERLVAEINMEKKQKSQKAKSKTSESRKQLSTVRVIQRNLVYIVGLPLNLADEELLQQKMYFAQYGKVLKVSISRTSAGTIQQFPNNTCSVYITYSKEEEAVCCIQSVHGFTLDGRPLRACFGTTKYCHAWLRNVPCNNPDCLYLHEIGSQEDSFTKDEIISAHTRIRVQQITGFTNNIQRRSGNVLPPPADDHCNDSSSVIEKPVVKNSLNAPAATARCTPGANSSGKSGALPPAASWGSRASSCKPPAASLMSSNELTRQKAEVSGLPVLSRTVSNSIHGCTVSNDHVKDGLSNGETHAIKTKNSKTEPREAEQHGPNSDSKCSEVSSTPVAPVVTIVNQLSKPPVAESNNKETSLLPDTGVSIGRQPFASGVDEGGILFADGKNENLSSEMSKMSIDKITEGHSDIIRPNGLCLDKFLSPVSKSILLHDSEKSHDHSTSGTASTEIGVVDSLNTSDGSVDWKSDVESHGIQKLISESEDGFDSQRLRDAVAVNQATVSTSPPLHLLSHLRGPPEEHADATNSINYTINPTTSSRNAAENLGAIGPGASVASNRFFNSFFSSASGEGNSCLRLNVGQGNHTGEFDNGISYVNSQSAVDLGENNIISNMLEVDPWDDSWTSQNLPRLLADADKQVRMKLANSWKGHISNESRFSFARQEDSRTHLFDFQSSFENAGHGDKNLFLGQSFIENKGSYVGPPNDVVGFMEHNIEPSNNSMSSYSAFPSSKISSSRSHISAPPGFSAPSRPPPPPGFSTHGRIGQALDTKSGNHSLETTSLLRSNYEAPSSGNISTSDIELIDPAILAVGEGRLPICVNNSTVDMIPNFHVQTPFENYTNLQLLMQRSLSPHQNLRYAEVRDGFRAISDAYGYTSRHMEQSQTNNFSPSTQFSLQQATTAVVNNGHWDGWNEFQTGGDVGVAELLRNDRLGFNKFGMTSSGDLYNRSFGM